MRAHGVTLGAFFLLACSSSSGTDGSSKDASTDAVDSAHDTAPDVPVDTFDAGPLVTCITTNGNGTPDGHCEITATKCDDGHVYSIVCDAGVCNCEIDGAPTGVHPTVDNCLPPNDVGMGKSCGWNLR